MFPYFIVDTSTGCISNQIDWDGESDYSACYPGCTLYPVSDGGQIGQYRLPDGTFADTTLAVAKQAMKDRVNARLALQFKLGFRPTTGPMAGHTLQCRDTEDRTNWLTSQTSYMAAVQMGYGAAMGASFRTADNVTLTLTYQQGLEVLTTGMANWGKSIMARSWEFKDRIEAATSFEDLAAIDLEQGWPTS